MFPNFPKQNLNFSSIFVLLSANAFSLDRSKIWLFGKEVFLGLIFFFLIFIFCPRIMM